DQPLVPSAMTYAFENTKADLQAIISAQSIFLRDKIYQPLQVNWAGRNIAVPLIAFISFFVRFVVTSTFVVLFTAVLFASHLEAAPNELALDQSFKKFIEADIDDDEENPMPIAAPVTPRQIPQTDLFQGLLNEVETRQNPKIEERKPENKKRKIRFIPDYP